MKPHSEKLSKKELEVVDCLVRGLSNEQIASECGITKNTVKTHLKNIYRKLRVHSRTQAILQLFAHEIPR